MDLKAIAQQFNERIHEQNLPGPARSREEVTGRGIVVLAAIGAGIIALTLAGYTIPTGALAAIVVSAVFWVGYAFWKTDMDRRQAA